MKKPLHRFEIFLTNSLDQEICVNDIQTTSQKNALKIVEELLKSQCHSIKVVHSIEDKGQLYCWELLIIRSDGSEEVIRSIGVFADDVFVVEEDERIVSVIRKSPIVLKNGKCFIEFDTFNY